MRRDVPFDRDDCLNDDGSRVSARLRYREKRQRKIFPFSRELGDYVRETVFPAPFQDVQLHYLHHHPTYIHDYALCMHGPHAYSVDNVIETLLAP